MKKKIFAVLTTAIMSVSMLATAFAADTTTGLIGKFTFDENIKNEASGTEATVIGMKFAAPADKTFNYVDGVDGKAIYLFEDGNTNGLNLNIAPTGKSYTVSLWLKGLGVNFANPIVWIGAQNQSPESWVGLWAAFSTDYKNGPQIGSNDSAGKRYGVVPNPNEGLGIMNPVEGDTTGAQFEWTNVTMVVDEGNAKLYYNGQLINDEVKNDSEAGTLPDVLEGKEGVSIYLGTNAWDSPFNGYVDDLYVYDRALTPEDIAELVKDTNKSNVTLATFNAKKETTTMKPQKVNPEDLGIKTIESEEGLSPVVIGIIIAAVIVVVIIAVVVVAKSKKKTKDEEEE